MIPSALILSFILLIPLFIGGIIAYFLWNHRRNLEGNTAIFFLSGILLGESLYSATYSNELLLPDSSGFITLVFFRYLGMLLFILSLICFAFWYVGMWNRMSRLIIALMGIPGLVTLLIILTNSYHHLFYPAIVHISGDLPHFTHSTGILYMPIQLYAFFLLIFIVLLLIYWMIISPRSYGKAIWLILVGAFSPLIGLILYHLGIRPLGFMNLVPFCLILTAVVFTIALVKYRLYTLKPVVYRSIFNAIPAGILLLDHNRSIIEINDIAVQYLEIPGEMTTDTILDTLLPPNHPVLAFLTSEEEITQELSLADHSLYLTKTVLSGLKGEMIGTFILFTDISKQKEDEIAIERSELILRSTFESTRDGVLIVDQDHQILASNDRFWSIWTIPDRYRTIQDGLRIIEFTTTLIEDPEPFVNRIETITTGTTIATDTLFLTNGRVIERYTAPLIISGTLTGRIWTFHDISELKQKEISLLESEARYKLLLDNAPDLIWQLDAEGTFTYISPSWTRILGYAVESIIGKNFRDLVHPDEIPRCEQYLWNSINKTETRPGIEYRVRHADGSWHWHYGSLIISYGMHAGVITVIGTSRDISDNKNTEKSLKNANRQLNLLNSITRHDILNEVMIMNGYLDMARDMEKSPDVKRILDIFEEVVPTIQSQIEFTSIYEVLGSHESAWQNIAAFLHKKRSPASIIISRDLESYEIFADPMMERVFDNLLDNSIRHGERVTEISISCREYQDTLVILYQDNGIGIRNTDKLAIFKRGYGKNTGMGLFLVREVLQLTGISIFETGTYGEGARFEILVPVESYRRLLEK